MRAEVVRERHYTRNVGKKLEESDQSAADVPGDGFKEHLEQCQHEVL